MRRFITATLALCMIALTMMQVGAVRGDCHIYDVNCDGDVDILDVVALREYIISKTLWPGGWYNYDVNGDGAINILDLVEVRLDIVSDVSKFPQPKIPALDTGSPQPHPRSPTDRECNCWTQSVPTPPAA